MPHGEENNLDSSSWSSATSTACISRCEMMSDARSSPKTSFKKHSYEPSAFSTRSSLRVTSIRGCTASHSTHAATTSAIEEERSRWKRSAKIHAKTRRRLRIDRKPLRTHRGATAGGEALGRLEENHRTILILREFEGFDYQSIADTLHLNKGTVRSRLARARASLRKELTAYVRAKSVSAGSTTER